MEVKYKILIVEDDPLVRQIYTERLSKDNEIEVYTAEDGLDGLNKIKEQKFNLIFSGIQMPNKTGFELFQDLQSDSELSNIPFVTFSHLGRVEDMQKAQELGIKCFIVRGTTTPDEVEKTIRDILYADDKMNIVHKKEHKILVVEDNSEIRSIYVDRFRQNSNIIVDEAIDGADGINKIKENQYDLVFTGVYMPNKTGFDLFQEVQQLPDKKNIPIVIFSHWGRSEDIEMARQLGVKYFIIRGQSTPNDIWNIILDILNAQDHTYRLTLKNDSPDYAKFMEMFIGQSNPIIQSDTTNIKIVLSKDSKPYKFFIELDSEA